MIAATLNQIRDLIQEDVGNRGLRTDPVQNLVNAFPHDFAAACQSIAEHPRPAVGIVTGFFIPDARPPAGETDGPLGALFLARSLAALGIPVAIFTEHFCASALDAGLRACGLERQVFVINLPNNYPRQWEKSFSTLWFPFAPYKYWLTHLIALERPGPSHVREEVPPEFRNRCLTMSGKDITNYLSPAHTLFESVREHFPEVKTIGIGDGGNEIGMGKIPWEIIQRNIPNGGRIACRVPTDFLLVCGISNWGAYGLAAGVSLLRNVELNSEIFSAERERQLLQLMVEQGPLVDGVNKIPAVTVDGLSFERYVQPLIRIANLL